VLWGRCSTTEPHLQPLQVLARLWFVAAELGRACLGESVRTGPPPNLHTS
jgi:hypothetical protein